MPGWTLADTHPTQGRTFQRPLDVLEVWLLWDGLFNGALDCLQYCELRLLNESQDAHLFSDANIVKAWLSTKRRFPLAGAIVRGADRVPLRFKMDTDLNTDNSTGFVSEPHFVVREHDLTVLRPHEVVFGSVACAEEAQQRIDAIMNGPRPLSEELLARLYVFRETSPQRMNVLHFMTFAAHCVTDRIPMNTFARCLIDTLARGGGSQPVQISLEGRLAMVTHLMDREPVYLRSLSPSKRLWRKAVGKVIFQLRMEKMQVGFPFFTNQLVVLTGVYGSTILIIGRAYSSMSPYTFHTTRRCKIRPCLDLAYANSNRCSDCQLSLAWDHIWKCLPSARTSGNDSSPLPTVPARRDLGGRMGISKETAMY